MPDNKVVEPENTAVRARGAGQYVVLGAGLDSFAQESGRELPLLHVPKGDRSGVSHASVRETVGISLARR
jgi:hypothetical protein